MDLQRSLLIGAIAVLSFMLLTEWVAFKDEKTTVTSSRLISNSQGQTSNNQTPDAVPAFESEDDIPEIISQESKPQLTSNATNNSASSIIEIRTDTLQLAVDLNGGDIIEAALPRFLEKLDNPDVPLVMLENNEQRIYIAQSGLIGPDGIDKKARAVFNSTKTLYELAPGEDQLEVDLIYTDGAGIEITKRFSLARGEYIVNVDYLVTNNSQKRWQANLFGQIKRDSSEDPSSTTSTGLSPFLGAATTQPDDRFTKFDFDDMAEEPFKAQLSGGWIAMIQHYFLSAWIPNPEQTHTYSTRVTKGGFNIAGFTSPAIAIDPGKSGTVGARFYVGPKDQYKLKEISPYLELSVDYGWLWWIAQPLFWFLTTIYGFVGNWGFAIILLTVLIKALFFKLSATSYRSMANMRRVQPKMADIREQYADDKQKQSQAMMELYKKEKINPMGGCLPILVQMPVFIALYWTLMESVELRHAPFILWIHDLSVMDPYFVLPLMMGASMWFMQKLNPPPPDPMQAKIMQWMPVMFTFFFLWFPAGLVLYWVVNNLLSMAQQYVITRKVEAAASKA
ncbi:MAG: membrane protein insertase YidC [Halioglobus sp.]